MEVNELQSERQRRLRNARRAVIKLGTSVVTGAGGEVCAERVAPIVRSVAGLRREGRGVLLVSSGAVGLGAGRLGLARARLGDMAVRQACAAVGQSLLMHAYEKLFSAYDVKIAQVLLTEGDFTERRRYSNLRRTMEKLLKFGVVPVVNENDTVSTAELEYVGHDGAGRVFSDNDRLAALVMSKLEADALVLLSDVDGLLVHQSPDVSFRAADDEGLMVIPFVAEVTPELKALATGTSPTGRGGMLTKLEAAEIAMQAGGVAVIANGKKPDTLDRVFNGEAVGTVFMSTSRMAGKRRWIAYAAGVRGRVVVNAGAHAA
ncbi:MAG: glutamate 5-kinase, partial [Pyrinomonadaceae bacterium]|nr:glutamate 5-kinase [Pyrinomonadaceae bacterium]